MDRKSVGRIGEDIACKFLERKGFVILRRNYLRRWGEIDIIALKGSVVRFVEVKTVSCENLPDLQMETQEYRPEEMVHPAKLKKVIRTAELYIADLGDDREFQIDVVGVFLDVKRRKARCRLLECVN